MDAIFMNSKNRKLSDPYTLLIKLTDKIDLNRSEKYVTLSSFSI